MALWPCGHPQSVSQFLRYKTFKNPSWCHWMRLIIRTTNIYGLGVGIGTVSKLYGGGGWSFGGEENTVQMITVKIGLLEHSRP